MGRRYAVTMQLKKTMRQLFLIYGHVRCQGSAGRRTIADGRGAGLGARWPHLYSRSRVVIQNPGVTNVRNVAWPHWSRWLAVERRCWRHRSQGDASHAYRAREIEIWMTAPDAERAPL